MSKLNEAPQAQNAQIVYVLTRYGNIYAVYADLKPAQEMQSLMIAKGQICDLSPQFVKSLNLQ